MESLNVLTISFRCPLRGSYLRVSGDEQSTNVGIRYGRKAILDGFSETSSAILDLVDFKSTRNNICAQELTLKHQKKG